MDDLRTDRPEQSLADVWMHLARLASDGLLAACAALLPITLVAAVAVTLARPAWTTRWWPWLSVPLLVAAFGVWGVADRERVVHAGGGRSARGWRAVQGVAVIIAIASAAVIALWFLRAVVGTWIS